MRLLITKSCVVGVNTDYEADNPSVHEPFWFSAGTIFFAVVEGDLYDNVFFLPGLGWAEVPKGCFELLRGPAPVASIN
jgi:hypothetical protein